MRQNQPYGEAHLGHAQWHFVAWAQLRPVTALFLTRAQLQSIANTAISSVIAVLAFPSLL